MSGQASGSNHRQQLVLDETTIVFDRITGFVLTMDWTVADELVRRGVLRRSLSGVGEDSSYFVNDN